MAKPVKTEYHLKLVASNDSDIIMTHHLGRDHVSARFVVTDNAYNGAPSIACVDPEIFLGTMSADDDEFLLDQTGLQNLCSADELVDLARAVEILHRLRKEAGKV